MTSGAIYLMREGGLVELSEVAYESERLLQELLADYPKLLAGEQIDVATPRRWVLVRRESAVPAAAGGGGRWSLDYLFLDQDGVPTLVEVKRSTDTRIRREVVGQMLDYAANAVAYWPVEKLLGEFEEACQAVGVDPDVAIGELVAGESSVEEYWQHVKTNLQAGRIRMIFVADVVPPELQRIVEFLNEQLDPAEVYAVEVRRFASADATALVPRLIGSTAEAHRRKGTARSYESHRWTEAEYLEKLGSSLGPEAQTMAQAILDWATKHHLIVRWGRGATGTMQIKHEHGGIVYNLFNVYADGRLELPLGSLKGPYGTTSTREELLGRLNQALDGVLPIDAADRFPQVPFEPLMDELIRNRFFVEWADVVTSINDWAGDDAERR